MLMPSASRCEPIPNGALVRMSIAGCGPATARKRRIRASSGVRSCRIACERRVQVARLLRAIPALGDHRIAHRFEIVGVDLGFDRAVDAGGGAGQAERAQRGATKQIDAFVEDLRYRFAGTQVVDDVRWRCAPHPWSPRRRCGATTVPRSAPSRADRWECRVRDGVGSMLMLPKISRWRAPMQAPSTPPCRYSSHASCSMAV